jgi:hypothetical protein
MQRCGVLNGSSKSPEAMLHAMHWMLMCTPGELIWQRDTASEVRPVLLQTGGMRALARLLQGTGSERVRLKVLMMARRLLYEVGSTSVMDPAALKVRNSRP